MEPRDRSWVAVWVVFAVALLMRLWALRYQPLVTFDGTEYIRFAEALATGKTFPSIFPPGYPSLIAIAHLVVIDRVLAAALVSLVCGALLTWPVWWLARHAVGPGWAIVPALAVALHPELARFSAVAMSESAFFFFLYGGLALVAVRRALPAGLAVGAAFATRPEGLVTAGVLVVREAGRRVRGVGAGDPSDIDEGARGRSVARRMAAGATGFLILAVPCWIYFHATLGQWTLTPKVGALRETVTDWRTEEPRLDDRSDAVQAREHGSGNVADPGSAGGIGGALGKATMAVRQYPSNALAHGRSLLLLWPAPLLLLSLIGLWRRRGIESVPLVTLALIPFLGLSEQPRFVLGAVPALAILATVPVAAAPPRWRMAAVVVALSGAVWCGANLARRFVYPLDGWFDAHKKAGIWLSGVAEPDAPVMDRKPYVAFYARRPFRLLVDEPYERLVQFAQSSGVRYLVVDQKVAEVYRSQLEPLLYDAQFREREQRLELVYVGGRELGYGLGVFRVLREGEEKTGRAPVVEARYLIP